MSYEKVPELDSGFTRSLKTCDRRMTKPCTLILTIWHFNDVRQSSRAPSYLHMTLGTVIFDKSKTTWLHPSFHLLSMEMVRAGQRRCCTSDDKRLCRDAHRNTTRARVCTYTFLDAPCSPADAFYNDVDGAIKVVSELLVSGCHSHPFPRRPWKGADADSRVFWSLVARILSHVESQLKGMDRV